MPPSAGSLRPGFLLAQRYRIVSQLGQGGFANVYKAQDRWQRNTPVVIKQINLSALRPQEKIEATDTYNREIMYLSTLHHENLPRLCDHFTDPEHWYVVLEYIDGETLEDALKKARGGRFPLNKVLDIGITLCDVLHYLHMQHPPIIFRDIKPANILLTRKGRLYLIDFGIARYYRPGQTKDTSPLGSPGYAAPEQYGKAQTSCQSDIYGLGATLQTLLTGKEPLEILIEGMSSGCAVPRQLQPLVTQMLERDASKRPQNMDEVRRSLQRLKERSVKQRTQRTLAFLRDLLKHTIPTVLLKVLLLVVLLFLSIILVNGFASSPLSMLYLPLALGAACGQVVFGLRQAIQEAPARLQAQEVLALVWKYLLRSLFSALLLAGLFYCLYLSFQVDDPFGKAFILGFVGLFSCVWIIAGLAWGTGWVLRAGARWRQTHQHVQAPPLQTHVHRRP